MGICKQVFMDPNSSSVDGGCVAAHFVEMEPMPEAEISGLAAEPIVQMFTIRSEGLTTCRPYG